MGQKNSCFFLGKGAVRENPGKTAQDEISGFIGKQMMNASGSVKNVVRAMKASVATCMPLMRMTKPVRAIEFRAGATIPTDHFGSVGSSLVIGLCHRTFLWWSHKGMCGAVSLTFVGIQPLLSSSLQGPPGLDKPWLAPPEGT